MAGRGERELVETQVDGAQVLVGVFDERQVAERAVQALRDAGFAQDQVNLLSRGDGDGAARQMVAAALPDAETEAEGTRINIGTLIGLLTGASAGIAAGLGLVQFPGLTGVPVPVAVAVCAILLGILGAWGGTLAGQPVPEEDLTYFTGDLDKGAFLVALRTNRIEEGIDVLGHAGARNFDALGAH